MEIVLTDHAKERIILRGVPCPSTVKIKKATDKDIKKLNIGRRLRPDKVAYLHNAICDCYLYICIKIETGILVLTAYKYSNYFQLTGNRKKK